MTQVSDEAQQILPLLGRDVVVLHPRSEDDQSDGGGDIDCAVAEMDPLWPLRVPTGWRVCQILHYDVNGSWHWTLERSGKFLGVDALADPSGVGRLGFPTTLAIDGSGLMAAPSARAAYLTTKRLQKDIDVVGEWRRIAALARQDPRGYVDRLAVIFGRVWAERLAKATLDGHVPEPSSWSGSRKSLRARRLVRDFGAARLPILWISRVVERLTYPTGLCVLVAGPDGAGKSTTTESLAISLEPLFGRIVRVHWRPDVLPSPMAISRRVPTDPSQPHARPPHGRALALGLLLYHWADFQIGGVVRVLPVRLRSGLVLWERGWWDIVVDPLRYRLRMPVHLVRFLGHTLSQPDLAIVLEASPETLQERKAELDPDESVRQTTSWRRVLPPRVRRVYLDADRAFGDVSEQAREAVLRFMEERTIARLGSGWTLCRTYSPRSVLIPRGPRSASVASLSLQQPSSLGDLVRLPVRRAVASSGGLHLSRRSAAGPPRAVRNAVRPYLERGGRVSVARSSHEGRFVATVFGPSGDPRVVVKVATDEAGSRELETEATMIDVARRAMADPLMTPRVLAHGGTSLVLEAVRSEFRVRPWHLSPIIAHALGALFASTLRDGPDGPEGFTHGDCAPWNMLADGDRWFLVDWEMAHDHGVPFFDVFQYLVQAHAAFRRPSRKQLLDGLSGKGWVGAALEAYADGATVRVATVYQLFASYIGDAESAARMMPRLSRNVTKAKRDLSAHLVRR